jgi:DNA (cytosine-5)-methyltransferase 1
MNALNLYACLGGNRYKWDEVAKEVGIKLKVTAIERDPELARLYKERFPHDEVIIADAHQYLLDNYQLYDFIWSSPPCPTHSRINISKKTRENYKKHYPDMKLYQEIIFLEHFFEGKYVVENVKSYYDPLIVPQQRERHYYWTNFKLPHILSFRDAPSISNTNKDETGSLCRFHEIDLSSYVGEQRKSKIARNLVDYEAGKTIFQTALGVISKGDVNQTTLFE